MPSHRAVEESQAVAASVNVEVEPTAQKKKGRSDGAAAADISEPAAQPEWTRRGRVSKVSTSCMVARLQQYELMSTDKSHVRKQSRFCAHMTRSNCSAICVPDLLASKHALCIRYYSRKTDCFLTAVRYGWAQV